MTAVLSVAILVNLTHPQLCLLRRQTITVDEWSLLWKLWCPPLYFLTPIYLILKHHFPKTRVQSWLFSHLWNRSSFGCTQEELSFVCRQYPFGNSCLLIFCVILQHFMTETSSRGNCLVIDSGMIFLWHPLPVHKISKVIQAQWC